jgi:hypothetical protein
MDAQLVVPILPLGAFTAEWGARLAEEPDSDPFGTGADMHSYFGPSGRWLLAAALASLNLTRSDEIALLTTSDETYISTCVSVTAFNFAKISRLVTADTRVVIVVHEFGYVFEDIRRRVEHWREQGIVVIEDCAHIVGFEVDGVRVGEIGDLALYSLPKIVPVESGGLLRARRPIALPHQSVDQKAATALGRSAAENYLGKYRTLNDRRMKHLKTIVGMLPASFSLFTPSRCAIPWLVGLVSERKDQVLTASPLVDWGQTLRSDLCYLPTNPFVHEEVYRVLMTVISRC